MTQGLTPRLDAGLMTAGKATAVAIGSSVAGVNITTHSDAGDDFTVNTDKLVVEGDTGRVGIGTITPASTLEVNGSIAYKYLAVTAATTLNATHSYVSASGAGTYAITLPTAVSIQGRIYTIKSNMNTGILLTVNTTSSQTIDGATSITLSRYSSVQVISNGANWEVF